MSGYGLLFFFAVMVFLPGLIRSFATKNKYLKKSFKGRTGIFQFLGILGMILVAARFGEVPVFSMRIWLYLVFVSSVFFLVKNIGLALLEARKRKASSEREKNK